MVSRIGRARVHCAATRCTEGHPGDLSFVSGSVGEAPDDEADDSPAVSDDLDVEPLEPPQSEDPLFQNDDELEELGPDADDDSHLQGIITGHEFETDDGIDRDLDDERADELDPAALIDPGLDVEDADAPLEFTANATVELPTAPEFGDTGDDSDDLFDVDYQLRIPADEDEEDDVGQLLDVGELLTAHESSLDDDEEGPFESVATLARSLEVSEAYAPHERSSSSSPASDGKRRLMVEPGQQWAIGFQLETDWDCFCPDGDALFVARGNLDRIDATGNSETLCSLDGIQPSQLSRTDGGLLSSSPGGLYLFTFDHSELSYVEAADHVGLRSPTSITRHLGRTTISDALGRRCAFSGRQLVPLPALEHLIVSSEQSGEFALVRMGNEDALRHLPTDATLPTSGLSAQQVSRLVSLAGRLVVILRDGSVQLIDSVGGTRHEFALKHQLRALTLGLDEGESLAWLVLSDDDGYISVVQLQLETAQATRVWRSPWTTPDDSDVAICWGSEENALFLGVAERLLRLNRPSTC